MLTVDPHPYYTEAWGGEGAQVWPPSPLPPPSCSVLCRCTLCLKSLFENHPSCPAPPFKNEDNELQDRERGAQVPLHWSLGALQVLMSSPYKGEGRGIAMLNLLRTLSQSIAPSMANMWELEIPLLVRYLEGEVPGEPIPSQPSNPCTCWGSNHMS